MTHSPATPGPASPEATSAPERPGRLMARIYRDIGLAAVARELDLPTDGLEPELSEAVKRGARYVYLMPKTDRAAQHR
jgi:hypothetical protein